MPISDAQPPWRVYRYADLKIASAQPLLELQSAAPTQTSSRDVTFGLLPACPREPTPVEWVHHWQSEGKVPSLSLAKTGDHFLVRFPNLADFVIAADGCQVGACPAPGTSSETIRHLLLDQVLPRVLAHQGRIVLHASAVRLGDHVVAFVGHSGRGKSTLAGSFHAAGYTLLSDDGLVVTRVKGRIQAWPTYPGLRLWPKAVAGLFAETPAVAPMAHYSSKRRVVMSESVGTAGLPLPLAELYVLAPEAEAGAEAISLRRLSSRDACMAIIGNTFQLDVTDRCRQALLLAAAGDIAEKLPTFSLAFQRDFARLPDVRAAIMAQRA